MTIHISVPPGEKVEFVSEQQPLPTPPPPPRRQRWQERHPQVEKWILRVVEAWIVSGAPFLLAQKFLPGFLTDNQIATGGGILFCLYVLLYPAMRNVMIGVGVCAVVCVAAMFVYFATGMSEATAVLDAPLGEVTFNELGHGVAVSIVGLLLMAGVFQVAMRLMFAMTPTSEHKTDAPIPAARREIPQSPPKLRRPSYLEVRKGAVIEVGGRRYKV